MKKTIYKTPIYKADHSAFGGLIFPSDYNTTYGGKNKTQGSAIASRIMADKKFDNQCRRNSEITKIKGGNAL